MWLRSQRRASFHGCGCASRITWYYIVNGVFARRRVPDTVDRRLTGSIFFPPAFSKRKILHENLSLSSRLSDGGSKTCFFYALVSKMRNEKVKESQIVFFYVVQLSGFFVKSELYYILLRNISYTTWKLCKHHFNLQNYVGMYEWYKRLLQIKPFSMIDRRNILKKKKCFNVCISLTTNNFMERSGSLWKRDHKPPWKLFKTEKKANCT